MVNNIDWSDKKNMAVKINVGGVTVAVHGVVCGGSPKFVDVKLDDDAGGRVLRFRRDTGVSYPARDNASIIDPYTHYAADLLRRGKVALALERDKKAALKAEKENQVIRISVAARCHRDITYSTITSSRAKALAEFVSRCCRDASIPIPEGP